MDGVTSHNMHNASVFMVSFDFMRFFIFHSARLTTYIKGYREYFVALGITLDLLHTSLTLLCQAFCVV